MAERAREVVKLKRRDAAAAAADELSVKGWLPDWMVRTQPVEQDETELTETDHTDHAA